MMNSILAVLRGPKRSAADMKATLAELSAAEAQRIVRELEDERQSLLLDGSDKQLVEIEDKIAAANRNADRTVAAIEELRRRIAAAEADELANSVEQRGRDAQETWEELRSLDVGIDKDIAALATKLEKRKSLEDELQAANSYLKEHDRSDLMLDNPHIVLANEIGLSALAFLPHSQLSLNNHPHQDRIVAGRKKITVAMALQASRAAT